MSDAAVREIEAVLLRYASSIDTKDWDRLATCFLPDAELVYEPLPPFSGFDSLVAAQKWALGECRTQHNITNVEVDVDASGERATARSNGQAYHRRDDVPGADVPGGNLFVTGGVYHDDLVRGADGWRIARRRVEAVWTWGNARVVGLEQGW